MTSTMLVIPRGTTRIKKKVTIHGIVRHRVWPPIHAISISNVYAVAPRPASEIGHIFETFDVRTRTVPSPKNGSHTRSIYPSWYAARYLESSQPTNASTIIGAR